MPSSICESSTVTPLGVGGNWARANPLKAPKAAVSDSRGLHIIAKTQLCFSNTPKSLEYLHRNRENAPYMATRYAFRHAYTETGTPHGHPSSDQYRA
jgi:hypothetical protein